MSFNSTWRTHEPPQVLFVERAIISATLLGMITYGVQIVVFLACLHAVWTGSKKRHAWIQMGFVTVLMGFDTMYFVVTWTTFQLAYVEYRGFPGGPAALYPIVPSVFHHYYGNVASVIITWLSNLMLIWRCYTVWSKKWLIVLLPILLWIGTLVTGTFYLYDFNRPMGTLVNGGASNFNLAHRAVSLTLNMLLTALIVTRLLRARASAAASLGHEHGRVYLGAAAVLIESAMMYAVVGFVFLVSYSIKSLDGLVLQQVLVHVEVIAVELVILRIARGHAWSSTTNAQLATTNNPGPLRFASAVDTSNTGVSRTVNDTQGEISMVQFKGKTSTVDEDVKV